MLTADGGFQPNANQVQTLVSKKGSQMVGRRNYLLSQSQLRGEAKFETEEFVPKTSHAKQTKIELQIQPGP